MNTAIAQKQQDRDHLDTGAAKAHRRAVHGILLLDKPVGMTSNQALQTLKSLYNARKAGHTGSLDPLASGLLPVCFGEATKVSGFLLDADKEYAVRCTLGARTTTGDAEGEVLETCSLPDLTQTQIEKVFERFHGEVTQVPPMYSALKHQGQRLYDLAREGIVVPRKPRNVLIHALELKAFSKDFLEFNVRCSKGTYIRTLAEDLASSLGCFAHVSELRRFAVGSFNSMHTLDEVHHHAHMGYSALDNLLMPADSALHEWAKVELGGDAVWYFLRGQAVITSGTPTAGWIRVYGNDRFLGLAEVLPDGRVAPRRLIDTG